MIGIYLVMLLLLIVLIIVPLKLIEFFNNKDHPQNSKLFIWIVVILSILYLGWSIVSPEYLRLNAFEKPFGFLSSILSIKPGIALLYAFTNTAITSVYLWGVIKLNLILKKNIKGVILNTLAFVILIIVYIWATTFKFFFSSFDTGFNELLDFYLNSSPFLPIALLWLYVIFLTLCFIFSVVARKGIIKND